MAEVILGRAENAVLVDLGICVKTGRATNEQVTLSGRTAPAWVTVLLLFSIIGYLIAGSMTSHRYRVTLPFTHAVHDRWRRHRRLAWGVGLAGVGALVSAFTIGANYVGVLVGVGIAWVSAGAVLATANASMNNVGIRMTRGGDLILTRAHPAFVEAARTAVTAPLSSR